MNFRSIGLKPNRELSFEEFLRLISPIISISYEESAAIFLELCDKNTGLLKVSHLEEKMQKLASGEEGGRRREEEGGKREGEGGRREEEGWKKEEEGRRKEEGGEEGGKREEGGRRREEVVKQNE